MKSRGYLLKKNKFWALIGASVLAFLLFQNFEDLDSQTLSRLNELKNLQNKQIVKGHELDQISRNPELFSEILVNNNIFKNSEDTVTSSLFSFFGMNSTENAQTQKNGNLQNLQRMPANENTKNSNFNFVSLNRVRYVANDSQIDFIANNAGTNFEYRQSLSGDTEMEISVNPQQQSTHFLLRYGF